MWAFTLIGLGLAAAPAPAPAEALAVGVAVVEITPPRGQRMAGYFHDRFNSETRDPLQAKALTFRQGRERAALVECDLIGLPRALTDRARRLAEERAGIPAAHIAVAATHSHTGPILEGPYAEGLPETIADAIARAAAAERPARLAAGAVRQDPPLSFNRRFHMKTGPVRFNPGPGNPEIVRPAGPIDPEVRIVAVRPPDGGPPRVVLSNFALHLDTVGGTAFSADYPHPLEVTLRKALGPDLVSLFATGTCGDINHIDVTARTRRSADEIGAALARTIAAALPRLRPVDRPALAVRATTLDLPLQSADVAAMKGTPQDVDRIESGDREFLTTVRDSKVRKLLGMSRPDYRVEVQAIRLGPEVALVMLPGEVFVELGDAIRKASPFRTTLVIELANDSPNYIPTRKAFDEGSYETINSILAPGSGERIADAAIALLRDLGRP